MDTSLSRAVAAVVSREVDETTSARAEFMRRSGVDKSTFSRKIRGLTNKVSLDEAEAWARGLGWSLDRLLREARKYQAEGSGPLPKLTPAQRDELSERLAADLNDPEVDAARAAFFAEQERKKRSR